MRRPGACAQATVFSSLAPSSRPATPPTSASRKRSTGAKSFPVDLRGQVVYYVGPSPAKPGQAIGAAGPTTSGRMDAYTPRLIAEGLKGMIGKGYRKPEVVEAMKKYGVPYLAAVGGAGALISQSIKKYTVLAYPDLGPEAVAAMEVEDFPAIVVIDSTGDNYYETGQAPYREI